MRFAAIAPAVAAVAAVALLAGCGSTTTKTPAQTAAPTIPTTVTTLPAGAETTTLAPSGASTTTVAASASTLNATDSTSMFVHTQSAACNTDLNIMLNAVTAYLTLNGGTEVTEAQLVQAGLITAESRLHDVAAGGTVVPSPAGGCAS